mgnify:CR=1 FL=1
MNNTPIGQSIANASAGGTPRPRVLPLPPESAEPELTAGPDQDTPEPGLDPTLPTNPAHGAAGHQVPEKANEDEDAEGRSMGEQLFNSGARAAEQDKVHRAAHTGERTESKVWSPPLPVDLPRS